ncbi:hypothetical protein DSM112329_05331 [Paraconexibacter sp. AEG42_29]|uniref:Uncharacterized protein n=1 Tax=Paraconexibacter sp. AEG42_29 TaxID=2997339 RepID=A0AAU7B3F1_9ACTN
MPLRALLVVAALAATSVLTTAGPGAAASRTTTVRTFVVTIKPAGVKARFAIVRDGKRAYMTAQVRRGGAYTQVDKVRLTCAWVTGTDEVTFEPEGASSGNAITGRVGWDALNDPQDRRPYAEYWSWRLRGGQIRLDGIDPSVGCPAS